MVHSRAILLNLTHSSS